MFHVLTIFGIPIRLGFDFLAVVGILSIGECIGSSVIGGIITAFVLFAIYSCVVIHELAHALTAKYYGYQCSDITLHFFGGIATIEGDWYKNPDHEFWIAINGPLSSAALAVTSIPFAYTGSLFPGLLLYVNTALFMFNLLPVYPMDGGRLARCLLAKKLDVMKATKIACTSGMTLSIGLSALAFYLQFYMAAFILPVIAFLGGRAEYSYIRSEAKKKLTQDLYQMLLDASPDKDRSAQRLCKLMAVVLTKIDELARINHSPDFAAKIACDICSSHRPLDIIEMPNKELKILIKEKSNECKTKND